MGRSRRWWVALSLALLVTGLALGVWQARSWARGAGMPVSALLHAAELEIERVWHRLVRPAVDPAQLARVTAAKTLQQAVDGGSFLLGMQEPGGRFHYWYRPDLQMRSAPDDDNFLRQAGTAFSLTLLYEQSGEPRFRQAAARNLTHLGRFEKRFDGDKSYFLFNDKAKLGGIALPMLGMLKLREIDGAREYDALLRRLAATILHLQAHDDSGRFKSTYVYRGDFEYEKHSGWESQIYPGEAMLALAGMYRAFGDQAYRQALEAAVAYYGEDDRWRNHAFLSWSIAAMASMQAQTGDSRYAEFGLRMGDFLLSQQNLDPDDVAYGSFHAFPGANTGTYLEGLGEALRLARQLGDPARQQRYADHLRMGLLFLSRLQVEPEEQGWPERSRGGVMQSLHLPLLRIDNTQHAIGAWVRALRFLFDRGPLLGVSEASGPGDSLVPDPLGTSPEDAGAGEDVSP